MQSGEARRFPGPVTAIRDRPLPQRATPAGYSALIEGYDLAVPLPLSLAATGDRHRVRRTGGWHILTPRHAPKPSLEGHLTFALKYEGLDLAVLKRLFLATGPAPIEDLVRRRPSGGYARRVWFLYEWLTGRRLAIADAQVGRILPLLDERLQYGATGDYHPRYRLRNNLPGTPQFCPLVFRTASLERFLGLDLSRRAREVLGSMPTGLLTRTAAFLLLKDSRSSYAIEGESPSETRIARWGRAIAEAGRRPLDGEELLRLQKIVLADARFVRLGLRRQGGFVGRHDHESRRPVPDHISARPEDLPALLEGMIAFDSGPSESLDPVIAAACLAFGFVYAHPFEDGNGRVHRYLIHHVLARHGFTPSDFIFPISAAILRDITAYRIVLESYSRRLLPLIEWQPTADANLQVLNDTGDFYRFFDATAQAEFLYACIERTLERDLPQEARSLERYETFRAEVRAFLAVPDRLLDLLFMFLERNEGRLSKRAREKEFKALSEEEVQRVEQAFRRTLEAE